MMANKKVGELKKVVNTTQGKKEGNKEEEEVEQTEKEEKEKGKEDAHKRQTQREKERETTIIIAGTDKLCIKV